MHFARLSHLLSKYLYLLLLPLGIGTGVTAYYDYWATSSISFPLATKAFLFTMGICLFLAFLLQMIGRGGDGRFYRREGLVLVVIIWFLTAFIGGLPFYLSKTLKNPLDAYFEAMSGLTTTGASVLYPKQYDSQGQEIPYSHSIGFPKTNYEFLGTVEPIVTKGKVVATGLEAVNKGLLFWRSFMQWLGGMGIVALFIAIFPSLGVGGRVLFQAEVPGPTKDSLTPRIRQTASMLWKIYLLLTLFQVGLLLITEPSIGFFDAICVTFSTLSTGGFSVHNESIAYYQSHAVEWIVMLFMVAGGVNFTLYFFCMKGKFYRLYEPEFFIYLSTLLLSSSFIFYQLWHGGTVENPLRTGFFQLISIQTSTGFTTANYDVWPFASQVILFLSMYVGAMSGSTGGGIKISRHYMLFHVIKNRLESIFCPDAIRKIRIQGVEVKNQVAMNVLCFFVIVVGLTGLGTFILTLDGVDLETALSVNGCMINNIGASFRMAGPQGTFVFLSPIGKILSILWMVLGRLEFFAILLLFLPSFWKKG